jgi:hypothetical protein
MSRIVASTVVVLLVGSSAFGLGAIDQIQDTGINLTNAVDLMHGHQNGSSQQNLCVDTEQYADKICGTMASQRLLGNFVQVGCASGDCAVVGVLQTLTGIGSQAQFVGDCVDPKMEAQSLSLVAGQALVKSAGPGQGNAQHVIVLQEDQNANNPGGNMQERTAIVGLQDSNLSGSAAANGAVSSTMSVTTVQSQSAM